MLIRPWGHQTLVPDFMAHHQPHLKSLRPFYDCRAKTPCPSSTSLKIRALVQVSVFRHVCHVVRAVAINAKARVVELFERKKDAATRCSIKFKSKKKKIISYIKMHFNWSLSHVTPMPEPQGMEAHFHASHMYYDSTWNSMISTEEGDEDMEPPLSGYLHWLEEGTSPEAMPGDDEGSEIDRLAEKFIASCHEKFRLEKQESYRRYQEMLARSM